MTEDDFRTYIAAFNARDFAGFSRFYTDDVEFNLGDRKQIIGPQGIVDFYTGVFERHPNLKFVAGEVNFGWVPFWKQTMDQLFHQQKSWSRVPLKNLPSAALGKNVFVTVLDDKVGFDSIQFDAQMADVALFSIDYPHSVCLWPNSADYIARSTVNVDAVSKAKVLAGNAVRIFNLND